LVGRAPPLGCCQPVASGPGHVSLQESATDPALTGATAAKKTPAPSCSPRTPSLPPVTSATGRSCLLLARLAEAGRRIDDAFLPRGGKERVDEAVGNGAEL